MIDDDDRRKRPEGTLVPVATILIAAEDERTRLLKADADRWRAAYEGAVVQRPLLVVGRRAYYVVEFRKSDGRTSGLMLVNPYDGDAGSVTGIEKPDDAILFYQPSQIPGLLNKREELLPTGLDFPPAVRVSLNTNELVVLAELYWDPCDQSLTPFKPFYIVNVRAQRLQATGLDGQFEARLLVRVDGVVFTQITFGGGGM